MIHFTMKSEVIAMTTALTIIRNDAESNYRFITNMFILDCKLFDLFTTKDFEISINGLELYMKEALRNM